MNYLHKELASGRWFEFSLVEQLANIGSEVGRALTWREKGRADVSRAAALRALELMDLTMADPKNRSRLKEIARAREVFVDDLFFDNIYRSTPEGWRKYYDAFAYAARRER